MKIKHLIITRFMSDQFGKSDTKLFDKGFLLHSLEILKRHLLQSLSVQTCKDFELVVLIHDRVPEDNISFIYDIQGKYDFKITIIRRNALKAYVSSFKGEYDFIITSRIDYDDHIHKSVVKTTQKRVDATYAVQLYGLNNGISLIDGRTDGHFMHKDYEHQGYFSAFTTLIVNTHRVAHPFSIFDLDNHAFVIRTLNERYRSFGIQSPSLIKIETDTETKTRYIWIRHSESQLVKTRKIYHSTNRIVEGLNFADFGYIPEK